METHNRDIFPAKETLDLYAPVKAVISSSIVDKLFSRHEAAATRAKKQYHSLGRLGIVFIVVSTIFTLAERFVFASLTANDTPFAWQVLGVLMIIVGLSGIVIHIWLFATRRKKQWLLNRFAAERLRSIKFQAYPLAQIAVNQVDLARKVDEFYRVETARLNMELNAGEAAPTLFLPRSAVATMPATSRPVSPDLEGIARAAYGELRIEYQRRFAAGEIERLKNRQRLGYAAADVLYLMSAVLAITARN